MDTEYRSIPFPFEEIPFPSMNMEYEWSREQLIGFFNTWSALQHYVKQHGQSPIEVTFLAQLAELWPDGEFRTVKFPIFGRVGKT